MNELIASAWELLKPLVLMAAPWLIALIVLALVVRITVPIIIRSHARWKAYEGPRRVTEPHTWFKMQPVQHFRAKAKLLANTEVRELYAPAAHYVREIDEGEKSYKLAWLSPFPRAVKAAIKSAHLPRSKKLEARQLIAEVSRQVEVKSLPEGFYTGGDALKHYQIRLATVGKDPAVIEKLENNLRTQLALRGGIENLQSEDPTRLIFIAHEERVIDPLTEQKIDVEWLDENPAKSPYSFPLGIMRDGKPMTFNLHHSMCGGASGTGKGSLIQSIIYQLAPWVEKELVEMWFIDPKWSEAKLYERNPSRLFKHISVGMDEDGMRRHAETIHMLKMLISQRIAQDTTSIEEGNVEDGRDFNATRKNPLVVVFIDEYPTLYNGFNILGREGKTPQAELDQIVATGRSLGVFVVAATQKFDKTILEAVRDNIANWLLLGQPSSYFNDLFLGDGAREAGYDSTAIPRSNKGNGYATAGIGYARDESGSPVAFRLPFVSKDDMAALIRRFQKLGPARQASAFLVTEPTDDGDFTLDDIALD